MKRILLGLALLFIMLFQVAFADFSYSDLKTILSDNEYFTIDESNSDSSYVQPAFFSLNERIFTNESLSQNYLSGFENDWLVLDYTKAEARPVRRLWIYISSEAPFNISSITFSFNDKVCTFSGFYHPQIDITQYDNGESLQSICLVMGEDSIQFHNALLEYIYSLDDRSYEKIMDLKKIKMVLHGTEDIEIELPNSFILDYVFTDLLFPEADYADFVRMAFAPTTFRIQSSAEAQSSDILPLGENLDFAIKTNGSYVYNTPSSDLSGYESTDKWMFEHDENMICIVHSHTRIAEIRYTLTEDNSSLSAWELIVRCIESEFYENANFFNNSINYKRDGAKIILTSVDELDTGKVYYAYTFIILKNGIISISSNSSNDEGAFAFVDEIAKTILVSDENSFMYNAVP